METPTPSRSFLLQFRLTAIVFGRQWTNLEEGLLSTFKLPVEVTLLAQFSELNPSPFFGAHFCYFFMKLCQIPHCTQSNSNCLTYIKMHKVYNSSQYKIFSTSGDDRISFPICQHCLWNWDSSWQTLYLVFFLVISCKGYLKKYTASYMPA